MAQAARLADPIGHSPTMNWLVRGAIIGAAIGLGAVAIVGTGGLAAVAVVGGLAAGGAGIGEMLSTMSDVAKEVTGAIVGPGSFNVFTNGRPAARAHIDMAMCAKHPPAPLPIATGSSSVFINGQPAARVDDTIGCSAVITSGSGTVYIGGGKEQTDAISPENLVPPLVHAAIFVVGAGAAVVLAGPVVAVAGLALGTAGGMAGDWAGGKIFGEGSDGQKWSALGGGLVGGLLGGKGGSMLAGRFMPHPVTPVGGFVKAGLPGIGEAAANADAAAAAAAAAADARAAANAAAAKFDPTSVEGPFSLLNREERPVTFRQFVQHVEDTGLQDAFSRPLTDVYADVYAVPKLERPDVSTYLKPEFMEAHTQQFLPGAARVDATDAFNRRYGAAIKAGLPFGRDDAVFASPASLIDRLYATGDPSVVESTLGFDAGTFSGAGSMTRTYIYDPQSLGLRFAQGTEGGANPYWVPGGYTIKTTGGAGLPEMVTNQLPSPTINPNIKVLQ